MRKKILTVILIIFILFCFLVGYLVVKDLKGEERLKENIVAVNNMINEDKLEEKQIRKMLKTYVTTEDNAIVERTSKVIM